MTNSHAFIRHEHAGPSHVRVVAYSLDRDPAENVEVMLTLAEALDLARNLLQYLDPDTIVREHLAGNCVTCQNTRLVYIDKALGRRESVRCPDCGYTHNSVISLKPYGKVPTPQGDE